MTLSINNSFAMSSEGKNSNSPQDVPPRFVKINGITQLNPEFIKYREAQGKVSTTVLNPDRSLPVVSNLEQYNEWNVAAKSSGCEAAALSQSTVSTLKIIEDSETYHKVGLSSNAIVSELGRIFAKHEAPIGLLNKLMILSEFDALEFIVDDSGSMNEYSDTKDDCGRLQTRWEEALNRIKEMLEILAYVPTPKITLNFFNRNNTIEILHKGEAPTIFLQKIYYQLDEAFRHLPNGSTPARECLIKSFQKNPDKKISRYFFCDGEPNGGEKAKQDIAHMVKKRPHPKDNPLTFLSCTNKDHEVEWMKSLEEEAPYCAEYDDFVDEAREVQYDQGKALPFTKGFHLIGQLVGAMNPDDLDAMDESIPFTKWTLDNLLGVQTSIEEYRRYFDGFKEAQHSRKIDNRQDKLKTKFDWERHYYEFLVQHSNQDIEGVKKFKDMLIS